MGETVCTECGHQIASDKKVVGELDFDSGSKAVGVFVHNGIMNSKCVFLF